LYEFIQIFSEHPVSPLEKQKYSSKSITSIFEYAIFLKLFRPPKYQTCGEKNRCQFAR
jgi:hypothetical protein